ncbi:MAG: glycosyltransferase family 9 protein [Planctomycetota bacterium]|nr:glycosyltransferase family 9 protein [Planctomycetota bacterium]
MAAPIQPGARLLVRLPRWLGDLVMAEPTVSALAERWALAGAPERLTVAGPGRLLDLLGEAGVAPGATRTPTDGPDWPAALVGQDAVLLGTGSFRSALEAWRAGVPRRIGWARDGRGLLLSDGPEPARERGGAPVGIGVVGRRPRWAPRPFGATLAELSALIGTPVARTRPRLEPSAAALLEVDRELAAAGIEGPFALANLGGRAGSAKAFPHWAEVLEALPQGGLPVVAVSGPDEGQRLEALPRDPGPEPRIRLRLGGSKAPSLTGLVALARRAAVAVTPDSGPRHLFTAAGTPTVVLFGPTDPRHTADHLGGTTSLVAGAPCGPCHAERCPLEGAAQLGCWRLLEPGRIASAVVAAARA